MYLLKVQKRSEKNLFDDDYAISSDFLYKGICCRCNSNEYPQHSLYKEVDKKYAACILKTTESLDCALIGVCVVIRANTVRKMLLMSTHKI